MKKLTPADIEGILKKDAQFSNCIFPTNYNLNLSSCKHVKILLNNVRTDGLTITGARSNVLWISNCVKTHIIRCHSCNLIEVQIRNSIIHRTLEFEDCDIGYFYFCESYLLSHWLAIRKCTISKGLDVFRAYIEQGVSVSECDSISWIRFHSFKSRSAGFSVNRSNVHSTIACYGGFEVADIILYKSKFGAEVKFDNCYISERLTISECTFDSIVELSHEKKSKPKIESKAVVGELFLTQNTFHGGCEFVGNQTTNCMIDSLQIECMSSFKGKLLLRDLEIREITIFGTLAEAFIGLRNIRFKEFHFKSFINQSVVRLRNLIPIDSSQFIVSHSDLLNTSLNDIDFDACGKVVIYSSTLSQITYSDVRWPSEMFVSKAAHVIPARSKYERFKNVYRQLKQAAKNNDSKMDELYFQGKEWHYVEKYGQRDQKNLFWRFNDAFVLFFNRSNSFGTNWVKPLLFMLIVNAILFGLLLIVLDPAINLFCFSCDFAVGDLFGLMRDQFWMYLNLLNPTHNLKHFELILKEAGLNPIISNWKAMTIDVLLRLSSGYFIYQMIAAFRKFSRK